MGVDVLGVDVLRVDVLKLDVKALPHCNNRTDISLSLSLSSNAN